MSWEAALPTFCEFFAGGGMVRAGLGSAWECVFANDFDHKKAATYRLNWGADGFFEGDVRDAEPHLPVLAPDLVWASFPCQDLSLAGGGAGLKGNRSGTFWPFWGHMETLKRTNRAPKIITLENVGGTLSSHEGKDFTAIVEAFQKLGYAVGAMMIDAELFVPQSRPRLFFIGIRDPKSIPTHMIGDGPQDDWVPSALKRAYMQLPAKLKKNWLWWQMEAPAKRNVRFADLTIEQPADVEWHTSQETQNLLKMMAPLHRKKVEQAKIAKSRMVGTIYRRTRKTEDGEGVQRAEVRFDDVAGCLRTPAGGSSRQVLLIVEGKRVRSRLISARETARLMGLPDSYILPERYNEAYHLTGDGVVVNVVKHLSENILLPLVSEAQPKQSRQRRKAA